MKLYHSPSSPFVRKVMVVAHELGLASRLELVPSAAHPVNRDAGLVAANPLGKVPALVTDDATVLYDSRVICEYLDREAGGKLFPATDALRWRVLRDQALGDGLLDAAVLARYEVAVRPEPCRWQPWTDGQLAKVTSCLAVIEADADRYGERVDIGTIAIGCALGYLDFRFADLGWRDAHPHAAAWFARFAARPSMQASAPPAAPAAAPSTPPVTSGAPAARGSR
ncbi:MAG: glutathione S-transferase [Proteobacteria bacterium]|nr:glutathione S-transferase [Pseudomonadota bacterium]